MKVCPYLHYSFQVLGKKWNGLIVHYLSLQPDGKAHFSDIKRDLEEITPRALSIKLTELIELGLIHKLVTASTPIEISYALTTKGMELTKALAPVQQWAQQFMEEK
ncbi:winged helix-turn-helix transcriptional regulator [Paenibacillus sp. IITD108]|uniref:winged helix-turn-helix transcriptional regulator n=1 Tax=Paenibacillus sp. IITD108 TaxID=3116649 RepID=UPI002F3EFB9E